MRLGSISGTWRNVIGEWESTGRRRLTAICESKAKAGNNPKAALPLLLADLHRLVNADGLRHT
jgi:hypothetical protein